MLQINEHIFNAMEGSVWKQYRMIRLNLEKASPCARANARRGLQFPMAFQLAILQVHDY